MMNDILNMNIFGIDSVDEISQNDMVNEQLMIERSFKKETYFIDNCKHYVKEIIKKVEFTDDELKLIERAIKIDKLTIQDINYYCQDVDIAKIFRKQLTCILCENQNLKDLWNKLHDDTNVCAIFHSKTSMYINIELCNKKIPCLLDTGAQINIISSNLVNELKIDDCVDKSMITKISGVGSNVSSGIIPHIFISFNTRDNNKFEIPVCFHVMDRSINSTEMIIGLSTMSAYAMVLDFQNHCLKISDKCVEFIYN